GAKAVSSIVAPIFSKYFFLNCMVRYVILGAKLVNIIQNSKSQNQNYRAKRNNASSYPCKRNVVKMQSYSVTMANITLYVYKRHSPSVPNQYGDISQMINNNSCFLCPHYRIKVSLRAKIGKATINITKKQNNEAKAFAKTMAASRYDCSRDDNRLRWNSKGRSCDSY
ncbi:MAG: hypothetical protein J6T78_09890, partial [Bacteroidaceae bacterium]|nr:hypothetical protein [Bacteroidaceae bacterium]